MQQSTVTDPAAACHPVSLHASSTRSFNCRFARIRSLCAFETYTLPDRNEAIALPKKTKNRDPHPPYHVRLLKATGKLKAEASEEDVEERGQEV